MNELDIFTAAWAIADPVARAAYLHGACAGRTVLHRRLEELLSTRDGQDSPLDRLPGNPAAFAATATCISPDPDDIEAEAASRQRDVTSAESPGRGETVGSVIAGKYKLIEEIGQGGMGSVFIARQTDPVRRSVAVKVIKAGMDSKAVLARFQGERQALALMDHPNIARVLDAGATESGRPFFVMELVKGVPITQFCDDQKLTPRERLELFIPVCHAVQHAHQKGIIHRDLKPSNVLVALYDDHPVPKVIDFGVSKATGQSLTDMTLMTGFGSVVGTPEYMSPEQAGFNQLDIDTRSDVYSLGVLLYELLTGTTPVDRKSLSRAAVFEILRIVREVEPPRPSIKLSTSSALPSLAANRSSEPAKLSKLMRGELDWVVMKALEKDRARRYDTANGLARDVQRYLTDEVVEARAVTAGYRLRRFARRNKGRLAAAALLLLAMVGGIAGTTGQAVRATRAEKEALRERDEKTRAWQVEADLRGIAETASSDALRQKAAAVTAEGNALNEADRSRRLLYSADVLLASQVWEGEDGTASQCDELLRAQMPRPGQPDLREFCWRYQWGLMRRATEVKMPLGRRSIGITATGRLVTLNLKGEVTSLEFDGRGEPEKRTLTKSAPDGISLSRTGEVAAILDPDGSAKLFDTRTGLPKRFLPAQAARLNALKLSADGRLLVGLERDGRARVWDVAAGKEICDYQLLGPRVPHLAVSLDGKLLLASGHPESQKVALFHAGEPKPFMLADEKVGFGRYHGAISPDGKLAAVGDAGNYVSLYDTTTHKQVGFFRARSLPARVAFSPDGSQLAVGERTGLVTLWELARQQVVRVLKGHETWIAALEFAPDGKKLISLDNNGIARCWDLGHFEESRVVVRNDDQINSLSYSPDGRWLVATSQAQVWLHDLRSHAPPRPLSAGGTRTAVFSPDGRTIAGGFDGRIGLWQAETGRLLCRLSETRYLKGASESHNAIGSLAFSPDGRWLAVGIGGPTEFGSDSAQKVMLFDVENRREHRSWPVPTQVSSVAFSGDGRLLAAAGHDGSIRLWDSARWDEVGCWKAPAGRGYASVLFLPGGRELAAGGTAATVDLWDLRAGKIVRSLRGHGDLVSVMALSPDGRTLATGSWDHSIKLWDAGTGRELKTLHGHTSWLYALAFSPDGNTLASSGVDHVLRLWEAPSAETVATDLAEGAETTSSAAPGP
jgi:eukaryotic-like serine/threonine-protein kinase